MDCGAPFVRVECVGQEFRNQFFRVCVPEMNQVAGAVEREAVLGE